MHKVSAQEHLELMGDDPESDEGEEEGHLNETLNKTMTVPDSVTHPKEKSSTGQHLVASSGAGNDTDHENMVASMHTGSERDNSSA